MKLGELYVDLGVNSGSAFNTISNFAFQFNNLASLADKFTHSITNGIAKPVFKNAPLLHDIKNLSVLLGESYKSIQGIRNAAGALGVNWSTMTGKIQKFNQERMSWALGQNPEFMKKYAQFGLTDADMKLSGLGVINRIIGTISGIGNESLRAQFAEISGFSLDELKAWQNFFKDRVRYEEDAYNFTEKEIEQGNALSLALNELSENARKASEQLGKNLTPTVLKVIDFINKKMESGGFRSFMEHPIDYLQNHKPDWLKKYDSLDWKQKIALSPITALLPYGQAYLSGSLIGEGITTAGLNYFGSKTQNTFLSNLADLSLRGKISSLNSKPTIASSNVARMKMLDDIVGAWAEANGYSLQYTSAMGGNHKKGSGHYSGSKVDFQIFDKAGNLVSLPENIANQLKSLGYWGSSTGAVGKEFHKNGRFHYDAFIGNLEDRVMQGSSRNITVNKNTTINLSSADQIPTTLEGDAKATETLAEQFALGSEY